MLHVKPNWKLYWLIRIIFGFGEITRRLVVMINIFPLTCLQFQQRHVIMIVDGYSICIV